MQILHSNLKCALSIMDYDWKLVFSVIITEIIEIFHSLFTMSLFSLFFFGTVHFINTVIFRYSDSISILLVLGEHQKLILNSNKRIRIKLSLGISTKMFTKKTSKVHQSQWCSTKYQFESVMQTGCSIKPHWRKSCGCLE